MELEDLISKVSAFVALPTGAGVTVIFATIPAVAIISAVIGAAGLVALTNVVASFDESRK